MSDYEVTVEKTGVMFCTWLVTISNGEYYLYTFGFSKKGAIRAAKREIKKWERKENWKANAETFVIKGENK